MSEKKFMKLDDILIGLDKDFTFEFTKHNDSLLPNTCQEAVSFLKQFLTTKLISGKASQDDINRLNRSLFIIEGLLTDNYNNKARAFDILKQKIKITTFVSPLSLRHYVCFVSDDEKFFYHLPVDIREYEVIKGALYDSNNSGKKI